MQEKLIFSAAVENGCEKLFEVEIEGRVSYLLRTESMILGAQGEELWDIRERRLVHIFEYFELAHDRLPFLTPIELSPRFRDLFRTRLLRATKNIGLRAEKALFNQGFGFCKWMYWLKLLEGNRADLETPNIVVRNFLSNEPIDSIALRLYSIASFQGLLNRIYQGMLSEFFQSGTYSQDWLLYNLTKARLVGEMARNKKPLTELIGEGDELTILRVA